MRLDELEALEGRIQVSIHIRSEDRMRLKDAIKRYILGAVSIHIRSEDRMRQRVNCVYNVGMYGFNPHPVQRPDETPHRPLLFL